MIKVTDLYLHNDRLTEGRVSQLHGDLEGGIRGTGANQTDAVLECDN